MRIRYLFLLALFVGFTTTSWSSNCDAPSGFHFAYISTPKSNANSAHTFPSCDYPNDPTPTANIYYVSYYFESGGYKYLVERFERDPSCVAPQINDLNSPTHECIDPPELCPEGQHNEETDIELPPRCVCDNNLPRYINDDGFEVCQVPECPINYNGKALRQQNQTYEQCNAAFPGRLYDVDYITDIGISCCYATTRSFDDNSTPEPCMTGYTRNNAGVCIEDILPPDDEPLCEDGQTWDNFSQTCIDNPDASSDGDGEGGAGSDGEDYNETSDPYSGGETGDINTENISLEYNAEEVNEMLEGYTRDTRSVFTDFVTSNSGDLFSLYKISIPTLPSCGCSNINIDMSIAGHSVHEVIDICSPLQSVLDIFRPMLWFVFLVGMLFNFLRGD